MSTPMTPTPESSPTVIYPITTGTVIAQDPDKQLVYVLLRDGQGINPIPVLFRGAADALRIDQDPLPGKGTTGVIAFLNNDIKSGVWLGAYYPGLLDAIPNGPDSPFVRYHAHWSGYWHALDDSGNTTTRYPDGTYAIVGNQFTPYKHVRGSDGKRTREPVTASDQPPVASPMPIKINHSSGTSVAIDASGNVTIAASGVIDITSPTEVNVDAPVVRIANNGTPQYLVTETAWNWLTGHEHSNGNGGGNTGPPISVPTANVLTDVLIAQ